MINDLAMLNLQPLSNKHHSEINCGFDDIMIMY